MDVELSVPLNSQWTKKGGIFEGLNPNIPQKNAILIFQGVKQFKFWPNLYKNINNYDTK